MRVNVYSAIQRVPRNCFSHTNWLIMMSSAQFLGFPTPCSLLGSCAPSWQSYWAEALIRPLGQFPHWSPAHILSSCWKKGRSPQCCSLSAAVTQGAAVTAPHLGTSPGETQATGLTKPSPGRTYAKCLEVIHRLPLHLKWGRSTPPHPTMGQGGEGATAQHNPLQGPRRCTLASGSGGHLGTFAVSDFQFFNFRMVWK